MATPKQTFTDIANAIRERTNTTDKIKPNEMASKINDIPQRGLDKIIALTDCSYLFSYYQKNSYSTPANTMTDSELANIISYSDTSKATDMRYMFYSCRSLTTIPQLDTSNVTNMSYMFYYCTSLTTIPQLDTSKATDMSYMFYNCTSLTEINMINIGCSLDISSTALQHDALVKLISNLKSGVSSKALTMGSSKLALLSDSEKQVATDKGWTLA